MPLRNHFRKPISKKEAVHGQWPGTIVRQINPQLAPRYFAVPNVHLGAFVEIDVAAFEPDSNGNGHSVEWTPDDAGTAPWSPPQPTATLESDLDRQSEYEVLVYDADQGERLVAAIELVSPSNKDRPEHRRAFVSKCVNLLWNEVSLVIVDPVTTRSPNLFREVWEEVGGPPPKAGPVATLAVSIRPTVTNGKLKVVTWEHALTVGQALPTLPLWLNESRSIPWTSKRAMRKRAGR
jgi:hypothetical protein